MTDETKSKAREAHLAWANKPGAEVRLVYIIESDVMPEATPPVARCALVHTAPEMAAGLDLVCRPEDPPFPVVVQLDVQGCISQEYLQDVRPLDVDHPDVHRGPDLGGPSDPRWAHKRGEGHVMSALQVGFDPLTIEEP